MATAAEAPYGRKTKRESAVKVHLHNPVLTYEVGDKFMNY